MPEPKIDVVPDLKGSYHLRSSINFLHFTYFQPEHNTLARNLSAAGTVLLQNNAILPLSPAKAPTVAVIGWADGDHIMTHGGGSGQVIPYYAASPFSAIRQVYGLPPPPPPPP
eukprot:COSAG02_NODE_22492_length_750_cov_1.490015_1_plen_112_part_10